MKEFFIIFTFFLKDVLDFIVFYIPNRLVSPAMREAIIAKDYKNISPYVKHSSWSDFYYHNDGKKILCVGTDIFTGPFLKLAKGKYMIRGIVVDYEVEPGSLLWGIPVFYINDLTQNLISESIFLITSHYFQRHFAEVLYARGITEIYYYFQIEYRKLKYHFFKPLYLLRFRWIKMLCNSSGFPKNYLLFHIKAFLRVCNIYDRKNSKKIRDLKNRHKGERCFIIATGPSLTVDDVEKLKNEYTFSMNSIFQLFDKTEWRPTYYTMCDYQVYDRLLKEHGDLDFANMSHRESFISEWFDLSLLKTPIGLKTIQIPFCYLNQMLTAIDIDIAYSPNLVWGSYNACTVTNFAINIAQYMGFNEIYLLGVDFSYTSAAHHFDGSFSEIMQDAVLQERVLENTLKCYETVRKSTEKCGVRVYNATRGGKLEVFERIDFDSIDLHIHRQ